MQKATCSQCKNVTSVNPLAQAARLKKFGSQEAIDAKWICRTCAPKKAPPAKKAKPVEPVEVHIAPEDRVIDVSELDVPGPVVEEPTPTSVETVTPVEISNPIIEG